MEKIINKKVFKLVEDLAIFVKDFAQIDDTLTLSMTTTNDFAHLQLISKKSDLLDDNLNDILSEYYKDIMYDYTVNHTFINDNTVLNIVIPRFINEIDLNK